MTRTQDRILKAARHAICGAIATTCAVMFVATPASAETAEAEIGALTLTYNADRWSVEGDIIRCIAEDCLGAVLDVAMVEDGQRCTREFAAEEAALRFPDAERHAANLYALDNLAVVIAQSGRPFDPDIGRAVYACVSRGDIRYEFTVRIGDDPIPPRQDGAIYLLLQGLSAPPRGALVLDLGGLAIPYDGDAFRVEAGPAEGQWSLICQAPYCREEAAISVTASPAGEAECFADEVEDSYLFADAMFTEIATGDGAPAFSLRTVPSMCRAMSPPMLDACAVHEGIRYRISSGVLPGCFFDPYVSSGLFLEIVRSIQASP